MPVQTSYSVYHDEKYAGMVNKLNPFHAKSRLNGSGDTIPFGYGVIADPDVDGGAMLPDDTGTALLFQGVAMHELNRAYEDDDTFGAIDGYDFTVVDEGRIAVVVGGAVSADDQAYLVIGDGTASNDLLGKFTNAVGSTTSTAVLIPNAKFEEDATADGDVVWLQMK